MQTNSSFDWPKNGLKYLNFTITVLFVNDSAEREKNNLLINPNRINFKMSLNILPLLQLKSVNLGDFVNETPSVLTLLCISGLGHIV